MQTTILQTLLQTDAGRLDLSLGVGVLLLDVVRISGSDTAGRADTTSANNYGVGVLVKSNYPSTGRGLIATQGIVEGITDVDGGVLVPNTRYILSRSPGKIIDVDDTVNVNYPQAGEFLQFVGYGVTPTKLFVTISPILLGIA